jgi:hypothetical protein
MRQVLRRPVRPLAIAALSSAASVLAIAQQAAQPTFRSGVDVVQVDVSVLDKIRVPVRGLTAADFTVLEDGKPRPIVAFVPVTLAEPPEKKAAAFWVRDVTPDVTTNDVPREGRLVVIMFDWSIRFGDQQLARRIALRRSTSSGRATAPPSSSRARSPTAGRRRTSPPIAPGSAPRSISRSRWPSTIRLSGPDTIRATPTRS